MVISHIPMSSIIATYRMVEIQVLKNIEVASDVHSSILRLLNSHQFSNIDFEEFRNLEECLHRWLSGVDTSFDYSCRCAFLTSWSTTYCLDYIQQDRLLVNLT